MPSRELSGLEPRVLLDGSPWNHPVGTRVGCGSPTGEPVRLSRSTSTDGVRSSRRAHLTALSRLRFGVRRRSVRVLDQ